MSGLSRPRGNRRKCELSSKACGPAMPGLLASLPIEKRRQLEGLE
jgi:hypothetical protein